MTKEKKELIKKLREYGVGYEYELRTDGSSWIQDEDSIKACATFIIRENRKKQLEIEERARDELNII